MTDNTHTLVIGGSSGMGLALAQRLLPAGHRVTIAARDTGRLTAATAQLGRPDHVRAQRVDIAEESSIAALFDTVEAVDHVVVTAADMRRGYGPLTVLPTRDARSVLDIKVLGPWLVAKYAADMAAPRTTGHRHRYCGAERTDMRGARPADQAS
ncbi:hypothetical protein C5E45_33630 [Nocardia nova]|uniref:Short-chain dehydrogenase n=1 Tax=Nocardia nova TaxID=37330 RepID=A0A2S6ABA0_9NOCA|nr:SDR family NAD(P)-dependent oxidoreductase [Nocardia nova]PPJ19538.1 hypothetical protein C5E41_31355 [Nocardia nova]PPJ30743.1 hypothetical protein C5E45_33630 [Nocardia nova]